MRDPATADKTKKPGLKATWWLGFLISVVTVIISFGVVEAALRIVGFSFRLYPEKFDFGFETRQSNYIPDYYLFWTPKDYKQRIQSLIQNPPRVLFIGDSCTEYGKYDRYLAKLLRQNHPQARVSMAKIGVAGWASYQGLQQMKRDVVRIKPKVVTIYFGWNDHWLGFGLEDKEIAKFHSPFWSFLQHFRVVQLGLKAYLGRMRQYHPQSLKRVSLEDYRKNLTEIVRVAKEQGIVPVLIAAPTSHLRGQEPAYLKGRFIERLEDLIPLHESYLAVLREVAAQEEAPLCDLARDFSALPRHDLEVKYFKSSGIHLWPAGDKKMAEFLYSCFEREDLLSIVVS